MPIEYFLSLRLNLDYKAWVLYQQHTQYLIINFFWARRVLSVKLFLSLNTVPISYAVGSL